MTEIAQDESLVNSRNGATEPVRTFVMAGSLAKSFGVSVMAISYWRHHQGLPHHRVRCDQSALGYTYVYDLDAVKAWAHATGRKLRRTKLKVGKAPSRPMPGSAYYRLGTVWRKSKPAPVARIPRDISP